MPHGAEIQGDSGKSLADIYDVKGSVVSLEEVDAQVIAGVHDMGGLILSERMGSSINLLQTGDLLQTVDILVTGATQFPGITRILNLYVFADAASRVEQVSINVASEDGAREVPIWVWDSGNDAAFPQRIRTPGGAYAVFTALRSLDPMQSLPGMLFGAGQRAQVGHLTMTGTTLTFGAGTVEVFMVAQIATADILGTGVGSPSNVGLPIPSW